METLCLLRLCLIKSMRLMAGKGGICLIRKTNRLFCIVILILKV